MGEWSISCQQAAFCDFCRMFCILKEEVEAKLRWLLKNVSCCLWKSLSWKGGKSQWLRQLSAEKAVGNFTLGVPLSQSTLCKGLCCLSTAKCLPFALSSGYEKIVGCWQVWWQQGGFGDWEWVIQGSAGKSPKSLLHPQQPPGSRGWEGKQHLTFWG